MLFTLPSVTIEEKRALDHIDALRQDLQYYTGTPRRWTGTLRRLSFARALQGSNTIEGYNVSVEDAVAIADDEEPLDANVETRRAVAGYRSAMTYVLQTPSDTTFSYGDALIKSMHFMMIQHDLSKHPGQWRMGPVFVKNDERGEIVYEGAPGDQVAGLMRELVAWLNEGDLDAHVLLRAAMAHLNLVMVHPFSDGNGRMGRCLQTLVLARKGILSPEFSSVEEYLGRNQQAYYDVLAEVGAGAWHPERDARPWIRFMLLAHYRQATTLLRRMREIETRCDIIQEEMTEHGLPDRVLSVLLDATAGFKVRNATYRSAEDIQEYLAGRDLKGLVTVGLLTPHGEKRGRYYLATRELMEKCKKARQPRTEIDPFEPTPTPPPAIPSRAQLRLY